MKDFVVWLDSKNAHVFAMQNTGIEKSIVSKSDKSHHTRHKKDMRSDSNSEHYYSRLAAKIKEADQLLIMGPGLAKNHFKDYLTTHQANTLAKKIIGIEKIEGFKHKTEKQVLASANKIFKTYDLYNNPTASSRFSSSLSKEPVHP
jgi:stalled ribosome rescue protein Dom34